MATAILQNAILQNAIADSNIEDATNIEAGSNIYLDTMQDALWNEGPLKNWNINDILYIDFRSSKGKEIKNTTQLSSLKIQKYLREFLKNIKAQNPQKMRKIRKIEYIKSVKSLHLLHLLNSVKKNLMVHSFFKESISRIILKFRGPAYFNRDISANQEDFYTLENISEIENIYFHSFYENKHIFSFDIRSLANLILSAKKEIRNPFTNFKLPSYTIKLVQNFMNTRIGQETFFNIKSKNSQISDDQKVKNLLFDLFQHIDSFGYVTNLDWFLSMNIYKLRQWYIIGEDIWNVRANLTQNEKYKIAPFSEPFPINCRSILRIKSIKKLQFIILQQIQNLILYGDDANVQALGCIYVLMIFTEIDPVIAQTLPAIAQYEVPI
jgi:hypothetical protein